VTSQHPETHNERIFQTTFGETISQALEQLRRPDDYTNPQQAWEPFKEVIFVLSVQGNGQERVKIVKGNSLHSQGRVANGIDGQVKYMAVVQVRSL